MFFSIFFNQLCFKHSLADYLFAWVTDNKFFINFLQSFETIIKFIEVVSYSFFKIFSFKTDLGYPVNGYLPTINIYNITPAEYISYLLEY